jgi:hypothetical protein
MIPVAPTWAFFGAAIDAPAEPHLPIGAHLRFQPSTKLGLPVTPLFVRRMALRRPEVHADRTDITWVDSHGHLKTTPFVVTPDNPVRGYLPKPSLGRCSWLEVSAAGPSIAVDACIKTSRGPAVIATRSASRYVVSGQHIQFIVVRGTGEVHGVRWLDIAASGLLDLYETPWRRLSLPVAPALRYAPTPDAVAAAAARVSAGAPRRTSLIQDPDIASPAVAPVIGSPAAQETARINALRGSLDLKIDRLINDPSATQHYLVQTTPITGIHSTGPGTEARLPYLTRVLQSMADVGIARYLGFADIDPTAPEEELGSLLVYHAIAGWQIDLLHLGAYSAAFAAAHGEMSLAEFVQRVPEASGLPYGSISSVWPLAALAVATTGFPPDRPSPPIPEPPVDRGWRADHPPEDVLRVVGLPARGFAPAASVSLARRQGATWVSRNPGTTQYRLPLVPSVMLMANGKESMGRGHFVDHQVPPGMATWRMCQADWFGRWSEWAEATAPAKARTRPPDPCIEASYQPAAPPDPDHSDPLSGTLHIAVAIPAIDQLPPGGHLLSSLRLTFDDGIGPATVATYSVNPPPPSLFHPKDANQPFDRLLIAEAGPGLARCESRKIAITGQWIDSSGALSVSGPAIKLTMIDPRPPLAPFEPTALLYSARPDGTGKSRFRWTWTPNPSTPAKTRYRVYFTSETTALRFLALSPKPGYAAAAIAIAAESAGAERAGAFLAHKAKLEYGAFECLSREPIELDASDEASFEHTLSGSLEGIALYKIVAESDHGVVSDFAAAPLLRVAVPNAGAPARPLLSVTKAPPVGGVEQPGVILRVVAPKSQPGAGPIQAWRLRRTITARTDPRQYREVANGTIVIPPDPAANAIGTDRAIEFTITDPHPLVPWTMYQWSVEVQAGPPLGAPNTGTVPGGEWSAPAAPARFSLTPPPPPAPVAVTAVRGSDSVILTITLDAGTPDLRSTPRGAYHIEIVRKSAAGREALPEIAITPDPGDATLLTAVDKAPVVDGYGAPVNTTYAVRIVDPIGRASAFQTTTQPV